SWEGRLSAFVPNLPELTSFLKKTSLALLVAQAILCLGAVLTRVMLHGDGSYFVYAIALGEPWDFKWTEIATRASIYILTVVPSAFVDGVFNLSGDHVAAVNGFTFYGVQWIQYLIVVMLAWRQFPHLLIFPLLQYALSTGLGFGFPSEILLAPGFLWICLFALIRQPVPWLLLCAAFAGLCFSHELSIPSALLVLAFSWLKQRHIEPGQRFGSRLFACTAVAILAVWLFVKLNGGSRGADSNAIYVFDPRRVLNYPALWLIAITVLAIGAAARAKFARHRQPLWAIGFACALATALASLLLDSVQGRYDSARTLIAVWMIFLGLSFIFVMERPEKDRKFPGPAAPGAHAIKSVTVAILSINLTANVIFLYEWNKAINAFSSVVNTDPGTGRIEIVSDDKLRKIMGPAATNLNDRMGFSWTWPYRSIVVAKDFRPAHVIVDPEMAHDQCKKLSLQTQTSRIPSDVIEAVSRYACAQPAPPDRRYLRQWFLNWW
ncbi:MAG TPA: hypothetical protein VFO36_00225, partial [Nitrospiraceae bacterium]|nr:hypothetical protein [Nitrospiraceae bacterium]